MFVAKLLLASALLLCASARYVQRVEDPYDEYRLSQYDVGVEHSGRLRRQAEGRLTLNGDGSAGIDAKIPLAHNDKNQLSAVGSLNLDSNLNTASKGIGLRLDNVNGHSLSVVKHSVPGFGSTLTAAGHATLFNNDKHNVGASAFVTRNMPTSIPNMPNYNSFGGGLDYTYKNKIGGSLGMAQTPFLDRKEYSAMGNLNVYRSPTSSVNFNAGFKGMDAPGFSTGWKPNFGLIFSRSF